ncbi:MAG: hypothetical protein WC420_03270 [Candidatus Paceibacterota bacterium]|jgi:hypothetical protein
MVKKEDIIIVLLALILVAFTCWAIFTNLPQQTPSVPTEKNNTVFVNNTIYVYATPTPEQTRIVTPRPTPTPKPRMKLEESSAKSIFEIDFGRFVSGIPAEERALILGKENPKWQSLGWREIAYNVMINFQPEKKKKVNSIEGTFERFIYSLNGVIYLTSNISVTSGTVTMLNKYGITMYVGEFDNQEGGKDKFVNAYLGDPNDNVIIASGIGGDLKITTVYIPGSNDSSTSNDSPGGEVSSDNPSSDSPTEGEGDVPY